MEAPVEREAPPLVEGSLWKAIWVMSWPLTLTTIATSVVGMVDVQVAGLLGAEAQAAVGLAEQVIFLFMVFLMSLGVGTTAIVSRLYGERKVDEAEYATGQSLSLSIVAGLFLTLLAIFTANYVVPFFSTSASLTTQADLYLTIFAFYLAPFSLVVICNAAFRGIGDAKTPLLIIVVEVAINILGDYLTVVKDWPIPGLGIRGIALSAVVGALVGSLLAIFCLSRSPLKTSLKQILPASKEAAMRVIRIGLPAAFQRLGWAGSTFVLFFILSRLPAPTAALASWTIGMRVEAILFMPLLALSLAVGSIVGQNLGAGKLDRATRAGWQVTSIGVVLMLVLATILFVYAESVASLMSRDPETIRITASYLRINALAEPFLAVSMILSGALQGAGDTKITMWISICCNWIVRLPLAWWLALHANFQADGAWIAMAVSVMVSSLIVALRFNSGAWARVRV